MKRLSTGEKTGENMLRARADSDTVACVYTHTQIHTHIYIYMKWLSTDEKTGENMHIFIWRGGVKTEHE